MPQDETPARLARGYLICFTATALWSSTGVFIRFLTESYRLPALVLAFWRDLFVTGGLLLALILISPRRIRSDRKHIRFFWQYGIVLALFNSLWTISVALNGAAAATVLAYSSAAFSAVLGRRLFNESLGPVKITAVTLSLLGCVLVAGAHDPSAWGGNPAGVLTGLLSGLGFASFSLMGKTASRRGIDPWTTMLYGFAIAAVFLLAFNLIPNWLPQGLASTNLLWLGNQVDGWAVLLVLAIGPTIGGYGLYTVSLGYLPASVANIIATLEPVMTAVLAYIFLNERLSGIQLAGGGLILLGVLLLRLENRKNAPRFAFWRSK